MPLLHPTGKGAPDGWRWPAQAFAELKRWGIAAGEPVYKWQLSFPTRLETLRGGQWRLFYTENRKEYDVYVGYDSRSAADGIKRIVPTMKELARKRGTQLATEIEYHEAKIKRGEEKHPIYHPSFATRLRETWLDGTSRVRTRDDLDRFKKKHKRLMELLHMKAGILDMTMLEYLTKHPDSRKWPNPPETWDDYYKRHPEKKRPRGNEVDK